MAWRRSTVRILLQVSACIVTLLSSSGSEAQELLAARATQHRVDCTADDDEAVLLLVHGAILGGLGGYTIVRPPWQGEADRLLSLNFYGNALRDAHCRCFLPLPMIFSFLSVMPSAEQSEDNEHSLRPCRPSTSR